MSEEEKVIYEDYFQSNSDYYIKQLNFFNEKGRCFFNVPAFFVGMFWMAYRKMYLHILIFFVLIYLQITIEEALFNYSVISASVYEIVNYISMIVWPSLFGFFSNKLYVLKAKKDVSVILSEELNIDNVKKIVTKKGGTNQFAPLILLLFLILLLYLGF